MDGKPNARGHAAETGHCVRLPGWHVLQAEGPEAGVFLQAQTMNDLRALHDGHWQWNGCLSAKGRLFALFALLRVTADRFWLVAPDVPAEDLAAHLQHYVFRSKVRLTAHGEIAAFGRFGSVPQGLPRAQGTAAGIAGSDGPVVLDFSGATARWLVLAGDLEGAVEEESDAQRFMAEDLRHGLPHLGPQHREAFTPQMLSLERIAAFSLKKGCYPGQEIVARTHFLGQAKRSLTLLRVAGPATPGQDVSGGAGGPIVSAAPGPDGSTLALAVLPQPVPADLLVNGAAAEPLALSEGLAR
ncbi:MAG TPA: folate-binding protein [Xanthomonadaceae bacterium]|nr:folate-binding protein [Xanthomonadaceae bacterium]